MERNKQLMFWTKTLHQDPRARGIVSEKVFIHKLDKDDFFYQVFLNVRTSLPLKDDAGLFLNLF